MPVNAFTDIDFGVLFFFTLVNIQFSKILLCFRTCASAPPLRLPLAFARFSPALARSPEKLRRNTSLLLEGLLLLFSVMFGGPG
jgi:hypothetical protein